MSDPVRLLDSGDGAAKRLLGSAAEDRPAPAAARATLVALGLTAPAVATAATAAPLATGAKLFGGTTAKIVFVVAAATAAVATKTVVEQRAAPAKPAVHAVRRAQPAPAPLAEAPTSTLSAENALVRGALDALDRHDAEGALVLLDQHRAQFPDALLEEEAAAVRIEALSTLGRDVTHDLALFKARFPDSPFEPVIKSAPAGD